MDLNLSIAATLLSILATIPQLYRTLKAGKLKEFHPTTLMLAILANVFLVIHGYLNKDIGVMLFGGWFAIYNAIMLDIVRKTNSKLVFPNLLE